MFDQLSVRRSVVIDQLYTSRQDQWYLFALGLNVSGSIGPRSGYSVSNRVMNMSHDWKDGCMRVASVDQAHQTARGQARRRS